MKVENIKIDSEYNFKGVIEGNDRDENIIVMNISDEYILMSNGYSTKIINNDAPYLFEIEKVLYTDIKLHFDNNGEIRTNELFNDSNGNELQKSFVLPEPKYNHSCVNNEEAKLNEKIMVERWNAHPELIDALQDMINLYQRVHGKALIGRPTLNKSKEVLKKYKK